MLHGFDKRLKIIALANLGSGHNRLNGVSLCHIHCGELGFDIWILLGELVAMQECLFEIQIVNKVPSLALHKSQSIGDKAKFALVGRRIEHLMDGVRHGIENAGVSVVDEDQFHVFPPWVTIQLAR